MDDHYAQSIGEPPLKLIGAPPPLRSLLTALSLSVSLSVCGGCAEVESPPPVDPSAGGLGKADVTVGPVDQIRCDVAESFVRRGGFAKLQVDARDSSGGKSRNYRLTPTPEVGARVVQRDQVIFDLDGLYTVKCCALDAPLCDQVAVQVGERAPAITLDVAPFSQGDASLKGSAIDRAGRAAKVTINGLAVSSDERGRFEARVPAPNGLNRYEVIATGSEGARSVRHAWTLGGPFHEVDALDPSAMRLRLGSESYPLLSQVLTDYFILLAERGSESEELRVKQSGSSLGYDWEVTPTQIVLGESQVTLAAGARADELALVVSLNEFQAFAEGRTRFAGGDWRNREVLVSADLYIEVPFSPHEGGVEIGEVKTRVENLNVEISDMPGFIEGVLELIFERTFQRKLVDLVESLGDRGLSEILSRFEVTERVELPAPLAGVLDLLGGVSEFRVEEGEVTLGIGLSIDGETDPARLKAPGPLMTSSELPIFNNHPETPYEVAFHLDTLNRLLFAAWQTGSLDISTVVERPFGERDRLLGDQRLTLFVTPNLPPVATLGERPGELIIKLGALTIDGVLESDLAVLNCALEVGGTIRALLSSDQETIFTSTAVEELEADVLIAPAGWEREPTRELVAQMIEEEIAPKYAEVFKSLPIPHADLTSLNLPSVSGIKSQNLSVSTSANSVTIGASLKLIP